jgi:hypothetical protein
MPPRMRVWVYVLLDKELVPYYVGSTANFKARMSTYSSHVRYHKGMRLSRVEECYRDSAERAWVEEFRRRGFKLSNKGRPCVVSITKCRTRRTHHENLSSTVRPPVTYPGLYRVRKSGQSMSWFEDSR